MNRIPLLAASGLGLFLLFGLTACGGGGAGDRGAETIIPAGTWQARLHLEESNCPPELVPETLSPKVSIRYDHPDYDPYAVTIELEGAAHGPVTGSVAYSGGGAGERGFGYTDITIFPWEAEIAGQASAPCRQLLENGDYEFHFDAVTNTSEMVRSAGFICLNGENQRFSCQSNYRGPMERETTIQESVGSLPL